MFLKKFNWFELEKKTKEKLFERKIKCKFKLMFISEKLYNDELMKMVFVVTNETNLFKS